MFRGRYMPDRVEGRNVMCCSGRLLSGPDYKKAYLTLILLAVPNILFIAVPEVWLLQNEVAAGAVILVLSKTLLITALISMFFTCTEDPGIIPRQKAPPEDLYDPMDPVPHRIRKKQVLVNNMPLRIKYCETCMIWRPPRSSHCNVCNNCVDHFDHHCPYLGNCIGRRNYRSYFTFITSILLLSLTGIVGCIVYMTLFSLSEKEAQGISGGAAFQYIMQNSGAAVSFVIILGCLFGVAFAGTLVVFHLHLVYTNQSTKESCTDAWGISGNPFEERGVASCCGKLCSAKSESKLRDSYDPEAHAKESPYTEIASSARRKLSDEAIKVPKVTVVNGIRSPVTEQQPGGEAHGQSKPADEREAKDDGANGSKSPDETLGKSNGVANPAPADTPVDAIFNDSELESLVTIDTA